MTGSANTGSTTHAVTRRQAVRFSTEEVHAAFLPKITQYPPILSLIQAAKLAGLKPSTLKRKISDGEFGDCVALGIAFDRQQVKPVHYRRRSEELPMICRMNRKRLRKSR